MVVGKQLDDYGVAIAPRSAPFAYPPIRDGWGCKPDCRHCQGLGVMTTSGNAHRCWDAKPFRTTILTPQNNTDNIRMPDKENP